jgi:hypothetical protein
MATLNGVNYSNTSGLLLKTNATTQMSISTGGVIEFNQSYTFPTSDGSANTVLLTNGSGALSFSTIPNRIFGQFFTYSNCWFRFS